MDTTDITKADDADLPAIRAELIRRQLLIDRTQDVLHDSASELNALMRKHERTNRKYFRFSLLFIAVYAGLITYDVTREACHLIP